MRIEKQCRGTRILFKEEAVKRRQILDICRIEAEKFGAQEIILPTIEPVSLYEEKITGDTKDQMYVFKDKGDRDICLRPEGTATIQAIASEQLKFQKDVILWYEIRCFRYERPQAGRYREFTQFGVEVINPSNPCGDELISLAESIVAQFTTNYNVNKSVKRGLGYYVQDGFEIEVPSLGANKQVVGGGEYREGIGFAIGVDRLALV